jgi:multiple sugar transport system substrate-binding protein
MQVTRRGLLKGLGIGCAGSLLAACQPKIVEVTSVVEKVVEKVVKETVVVEGEVKEITKVVEKVVKETVVVEATKAPAAPEEVTFQHFFHYPHLWEFGGRQMFEYIEQTYNLKLNLIPTEYGDMSQKLMTLIAGGTPPDLTMLDNEVLPGVAMRGVLLPLDERMAVDPPCPIEDIMPSRLADNTFAGKLFGMPVDQGSDAVYYNTKIFDDAGIDYPTADWTWDELIQIATALTVDKNGKTADSSGFDPENIQQWGFQYQTSLHRAHCLVTSLCGDPVWFDKDITKCVMDAPHIVEAFQYLVDLRCVSHVSPTAQYMQSIGGSAGGIQPFGLGYYAMEHTWIGMISGLHQEGVKIGKDYDVVYIPKGKKAVATSGGQGIPIVKDAKHVDAAWQVIKGFMSEPLMKIGGESGFWMPARISTAEYGKPADGVPTHYREAFIDPVAEFGFSKWWYVPGWSEWQRTMVNELDQLWMCEGVTAEEAIQAFMPKVNELVAERERFD